jgi:hypothetical protein
MNVAVAANNGTGAVELLLEMDEGATGCFIWGEKRG